MKNLVKMGIVFVLLSGVVAPSSASGQFFFFMENPNVGKQMKDVKLLDLENNEFMLSKHIEGQKAIILFWATWCPHCREQIADLDKHQEVYKNKNIKIVLLAIGEPVELLKRYTDRYELSLPIVADTEDTSTELYDLVGVPTIYYVNEKGIVQAVEHDLLENYEEILNQE